MVFSILKLFFVLIMKSGSTPDFIPVGDFIIEDDFTRPQGGFS